MNNHRQMEIWDSAGNCNIWREPAVRQDAPSTSVAAAESVKGLTASGQRRKILIQLVSWPTGMTDEELQHACWLNPSSERPRRGELLEAGLIMDSGRKGTTASGRSAIIWVATQKGIDEVRRME